MEPPIPKSVSKPAVDVTTHVPQDSKPEPDDLDGKPVDSKPLLDPVIEVNENIVSEVFEKPYEREDFIEISPRIFGQKDVKDSLTIESLNNAIYENGVVNLCWPEIIEPVFENRTCFPKSYYTNSTKERLLLAYAESFRRQYNFHYKHLARKPLLLQAPNECGLQVRLVFIRADRWRYVSVLL